MGRFSSWLGLASVAVLGLAPACTRSNSMDDPKPGPNKVANNTMAGRTGLDPADAGDASADRAAPNAIDGGAADSGTAGSQGGAGASGSGSAGSSGSDAPADAGPDATENPDSAVPACTEDEYRCGTAGREQCDGEGWVSAPCPL